MIDHARTFPGQNGLLMAVFGLALMLSWMYLHQRRTVAKNTYSPKLAWLRACIYFCVCVLVANASGVLATVLTNPLATEVQRADPWWWALTIACIVVIVIAYAVIWPIGTFTDGRRSHPQLAVLYGSVWGGCQGLLFMSFWAWAELTGLAVYWVALISYGLIGAYNGCWHHFFWDKYVSPPHNYSEWNGKKVLYCHTPNLLLCLTYLSVYGNVGIYVLLQAGALAASAYAMRFPAFWDDYSATPGLERPLSQRGVV